MELFRGQVQKIVDQALAEDLGWGDLTTEALVAPTQWGKCLILAKAQGVLAGVEVARMVFHTVDPSLQVEIVVQDGARIGPGEILATVQGRVSSILKAERTALNFLQHLSGIATITARCMEAVAGLPVEILDTRKTTPGLRLLEKYAVRVGGGKNHRLHLGDGILIKDNHLAALRSQGVGLGQAVRLARQKAPHTVTVEVEAQTEAQALEAVEAGADVLMLDNMSVEKMREVVRKVGRRALIEASGGITLDNLRQVAEIGVDLISMGALTHSVKALDISLELEIR